MANHRGFSLLSRFTYDVFISFRGRDTRQSFTAHLFAALKQAGIKTYTDNEIEGGENIKSALFTAIRQSRICVVVFSERFASSEFCLDELVKILECKERGQTVLPVFYKVDPCEARRLIRTVQDQLGKLKERFNDQEKVARWERALKELADLSGWHLRDQNESTFIQFIVEAISSAVSRLHFVLPRYQVGLKVHVENIKDLFNLEMKDTHMVVIYGMGGIGKTTIAKAVYNSIADQFQGSCFLENFRETSKKSMVKLQQRLLSSILRDPSLKVGSTDEGINLIKQRLSCKSVLLVIDDVDELRQFDALVGELGACGTGSKIIITTRNARLVRESEFCKTYEVNLLGFNRALELFSLHAFGRRKPTERFEDLRDVITHAGGLPLALEVMGSNLRDRSTAQIESALARYQRFPCDDKVYENLIISYNDLNDLTKMIFLDIACFFKGEHVDYVMKILEGCDLFPVIGISELQERCLLTIDEYNTVMMHDLLQEMGRKIVRSKKKFCERCRVWVDEDVRSALEEKTTEGMAVEGILVDLCGQELQIELKSANPFKNMKNLRLFINRNARFSGSKICFPKDLRLLDWPGYPFVSLSPCFEGDNVVVLEIRKSPIKEIDKLKSFKKMTLVEFSDCQFLTKIPDLSISQNLQELILDKCTNLVEVHDSVGLLDKLVSLRISGCPKLKSLPGIRKLTSLRFLILEGCSSLQNFPEIGCEMVDLRFIDLRHTAVEKLPRSIEHLSGLDDVNLEGCKNLLDFPGHLLQCVKKLSFKGCSQLSQFPFESALNKRLEELDLSGCGIDCTKFICTFIGLRRFILVDCKKLEEIVGLQHSIEEVNAGGCISLKRFPELFESNDWNRNLPALVWVDLSRCHKLVKNMENEEEEFLFVGGEPADYICSIIFPGIKIPDWFGHIQASMFNAKHEMVIIEPSNLDLYGVITGIALGAVIGIKDGSLEPLPIFCDVEIIHGLSRHYEAKKFHLAGSEHLWLQFIIPKFDEVKDSVRVKFQIWDSTGLAFFKSCGVHLIRRNRHGTNSGVHTEKAAEKMVHELLENSIDLDGTNSGVHTEKAAEKMVHELLENSIDLADGIQLTKRRREGHNYDHLENNYCPPQKRHCSIL